MCKYALGNYRKTYICLICRNAWKGPHGNSYEPNGSTHCGKCGREGIDMGHDFHVPRRRNKNQWRKIELMVQSGVQWRSCGCAGSGPGPMPKTFADAKRWYSKS